MSRSRQKLYDDNRIRHLELEVGDWVYFKISPMKGVMRFDKKGKLSPPYVEPYQILTRVKKVTYELDLLSELALVHPVFNVSMIKKRIGDSVSILLLDGLAVDENLSYEVVPLESLGRKVK